MAGRQLFARGMLVLTLGLPATGCGGPPAAREKSARAVKPRSAGQWYVPFGARGRLFSAERSRSTTARSAKSAWPSPVEVEHELTGCSRATNGRFAAFVTPAVDSLVRSMLPAAYVRALPH